MPPQAPQVTYQNGQLSIVAQNATLSAILAAVRSRTGAQVEMPAEASNDRVAAQLGPGNPRDVMASLLQGSRFDYIVLGSVNDPNVLSQVILTTRRGGPATAPAGAGQASGSPAGVAQPNQPGLFRGGVSRPEIVAEEEEPEPEPVPEPEPELVPAPAAGNLPQQPGVYQPGVPGVVGQPVPGQEGQPVAPGQPNPQVPGQVRTPEQLLQELQRMQQDQQQQQQQQQRKQQQQQN
jgi:hypothetical protein